MSNFSFFQSVFKRLVLQTRENQGSFGKVEGKGEIMQVTNIFFCLVFFFIQVKKAFCVKLRERYGPESFVNWHSASVLTSHSDEQS